MKSTTSKPSRLSPLERAAMRWFDHCNKHPAFGFKRGHYCFPLYQACARRAAALKKGSGG